MQMFSNGKNRSGGRMRGGVWGRMGVASGLMVVMMAGSVWGQVVPAPPPLDLDGHKTPTPEDLQGVGIDEHLRAQVPMDLVFTDESGAEVRLGDYFEQGKPVLLNLGYYDCPMLCGLVWQGMTKSLRELSWTPGQQFEVVTLSFDPREGPELAREKKATMVKDLGRPGAAEGWHFLTGDDQTIRRLAEAVGFNYRWDAKQQQYAHVAAIMLLSPEGRVSRYLYGVEFPAQTLRLSLVEASEGRVGSTADQILLYCFHFDPKTGQYTMVAMNMMRLGGALTLAALAIAIGVMLVREMRKRRLEAASGDTPA